MARYPFLDHPGPMAFAHQGGAAERPANSMAAFAHAIEDLGFPYLETDAHLTGDGRVVLIHDPSVGQLTDGAGRVEDLSFAELRRLRLRGPDGEVSDQRIPLLEEVLDAWPDVRVNIDAKEARVVMPLAGMVRRLGLLERVCLGSFSASRSRRLRAVVGPGLCSVCDPLDVLRLLLAGYGLPTGTPPGACAQVPVRQGPIPVVTERFVAAAHELGVPVVPWTIDDAEEMHRLLDLGIDGVITDRPSELRRVLVERGSWFGR